MRLRYTLHLQYPVRSFLLALLLLPLAGCPPSEPLPPTAGFTATPAGGHSPLTVQFTDLSDPGSSPITARYWNFGDAQTSTATNPEHTYVSVGRYTVTLRVVSAVGDGVASKDQFIEVLQPEVGPRARFTADPQSGRPPLTVQFTDDSSPGDRPITTWRWDFGDGKRSTQPSPSHVYDTPGTYTVRLTVSNGAGESTFIETNLINVLAD